MNDLATKQVVFYGKEKDDKNYFNELLCFIINSMPDY